MSKISVFNMNVIVPKGLCETHINETGGIGSFCKSCPKCGREFLRKLCQQPQPWSIPFRHIIIYSKGRVVGEFAGSIDCTVLMIKRHLCQWRGFELGSTILTQRYDGMLLADNFLLKDILCNSSGEVKIDAHDMRPEPTPAA